MDRLNAIYTEKAQCQDCYKCVRHCPVKAIKVEDAHAIVNTELCILCGNCVQVCPVGAKKIRDDLSRAKGLLKRKKRVIASLAPSFVNEFAYPSEKVIHALKKLGFWGVSETALGAQLVSSACAELLQKPETDILISSACPVIVAYITKYYPHLSKYITPVLSPALSHAKLLREIFWEDIGVVFIGPCIGKKQEAEKFPELINVAITFADLRNWLKENSIDLELLYPEESDKFIPERAAEGVLYPVDGGMIEGIKKVEELPAVHFMPISGGIHIQNALQGLEELKTDKKIFIEILACDGGCINGPRAISQDKTAIKRLNIYNYAPPPQPLSSVPTSLNLFLPYDANPIEKPVFTPQGIDGALRQIGKTSLHDELNCGGCGYNTCRDFAVALLMGSAENAMCVSYMRKLALNKANALIKAMPSGVVIVDENLQVIECNQKFTEIIGGDLKTIYEVNPGLTGAYLNRLVPFHKYFSQQLLVNEEIPAKEIRFNEKILRLLVFPIEKNRIVGGIVQDITQPSGQREQIITKAQQVLKQNLTTVQKIAFLLGENAAESEILLNSIIESFAGATE